MLAVVIAEGIALVLLAVLVLGLLRSHALILKALHDLGAGLELEREASGASGGPGPVPVELERGVVAPDRPGESRAVPIGGQDLGGSAVAEPLGAPDGRVLLAFLSSGCSVCQTFWEELARPVDVPGGARLVAVTKGDDEESPSALASVVPEGLPVLRSTQAWADYEIPGSPYFVYVDGGRIIGEGSATSWAQVRDLMSQAVADATLVAEQAAVGRGPRDDPASVDAELLAAGVGPDHESLYPRPHPGEDPAPR